MEKNQEKMEIQEEKIKGVFQIRPRIFKDSRGWFLESFNTNNYAILGGNLCQDNLSVSKNNVLRGLHFQNPPFSQGKLVTVLRGKALDVIVDLRKNSKSYGKHLKIMLCGITKNQLWVPPGFAHGFLSLSEETVFFYKCSNYYNPSSERTIQWNDPTLKIDWGIENPIVSEKDQHGEAFENFISPFE